MKKINKKVAVAFLAAGLLGLGTLTVNAAQTFNRPSEFEPGYSMDRGYCHDWDRQNVREEAGYRNRDDYYDRNDEFSHHWEEFNRGPRQGFRHHHNMW